MMQRPLTLSDYQSLAEVRYHIRRYLRFSEQASRAAGLEPQHYQLLLAIKGMLKGVQPSIGELAERMQLEHHSTVELVNRLAARGYVQRDRTAADRRQVQVTMTLKGQRVLRKLFLTHRAEMHVRGPALIAALKRAIRTKKDTRSTRKAPRVAKK
jgi:DNA-binding MarR family transcriptional regulator